MADGADILVVGAGSAGCVLAARLSEDPTARVLLVEAGGPATDPAIADPLAWPALAGRPYDYAYRTTPQPHTAGRVHDWPRGRIVGGSSCLNAMAHVRGHPDDFAPWAAAGGADWSYQGLLPGFIRSEHRPHGRPGTCGMGGPLPVWLPDAEVHPLTRAFMAAGPSPGRPRLGRPQQWPALRHRAQLTDHPGRAPGHCGGCLSDRRCPGPPQPDIAHRRDRPAHPVRRPPRHRRADRARPAGRRPGGAGRRHHRQRPAVDALRHWRSPGAGPGRDRVHPRAARCRPKSPGPSVDPGQPLHRAPTARTVAPATFRIADVSEQCRPRAPGHRPRHRGRLRGGARGGPRPDRASPGLYPDLRRDHPVSRGRIAPGGPEAADPPIIDPCYLSEPQDRATMSRALAFARELGQGAALDPWRAAEIYPADEPPDDFIARTASTHHHPVGTCRMGGDALAVTDGRLAVHGLDRLHIVDASVIPTLPSGPIHAAVIAIAETWCARTRAGWR